MRLSTLGSILTWIVTGGVAGYLASLLLRLERGGCLIHVALGIVGALVGGFIMGRFVAPLGLTGWGFLDGIINATVGAVIVLILLELILPGQQLGGGKRRRRRDR